MPQILFNILDIKNLDYKMEEHDSLDDDLENIQQPERFDLELELVRWVKVHLLLYCKSRRSVIKWLYIEIACV